MAVSLKHAFTSGKSDGADSTQVQPSNWNAEHTLTLATARLLGRTTAGTGAVEEISVAGGLTLSSGSLSSSRLVAGTAAELNPLSASVVTQAHGLAGRPQFFECYLECVTADNSYSIGDRLWYPPHDQAGGGSSTWSILADATNVVIYGTTSQPNAIQKGASSNVNLTIARWKLVVTPYYWS